MFNPSSNALITILFGVFGGLRKAYQLSFVLVQFNTSSILSVIAYAALSAVVGYFVKIGLDYLRKTIANYFTKKTKSNPTKREFEFRKIIQSDTKILIVKPSLTSRKSGFQREFTDYILFNNCTSPNRHLNFEINTITP